MTTAEISALVAVLLGCWAIGFSTGFLMTRFKEGLNQIV
jgi:hypothetical protein